MKPADIQIRDPFLLRDADQWYLFGSTDKDIWRGPGVGFDAYISPESDAKPPEEFAGPFPAFRPPPGFWSSQNFWAPEVYRYRDAYYMFATFKPSAGRRGTACLKAEALPGPFMPWSPGPLTPKDWECLDGTLFIEDSQPFMVFCHEWQQVGDGEICALPLSEDLREPAGDPVLLFQASDAPWVRPLPGRPPGSYVTDGPFLHTARNGALNMLWSSFTDSGYAVGVAVSAGNLAGPWRQEERPLYQNDGGHSMIFQAGGKLYLAMHQPNKTPLERPVFLEITENSAGILELV